MTRYAMTKQEQAQDDRLAKYVADARAGTVTPTPHRPRPDALRAWIDRSLGAVSSAYEPETEHAAAVHVVDGEYSETAMDGFRATAWAGLDPETQAAGLDPEGPGFAEAAQAFSDAVDQVAADDKAGQAAHREAMYQENMRNDPGSYGRA